MPPIAARQAPAFLPAPALPPEAYRLEISRPHGIRIYAADARGAFYAHQTLAQILRHFHNTPPCLLCEDHPALPVRGFMLDISRGKVPTNATLFALVRQLAALRINQLQLYTEHTFAFPAHELVWRDASPMTPDDLRRLDRHCAAHGIELVPNQQSFGHMERWLKHPPYRHLAECPDGFYHDLAAAHRPPGTLRPCAESLDFAAALYDALLPNFTSAQFNIGGDEPWELGLGRSQPHCAARGKHTVYREHLTALIRLALARGKRPQFWADILLEDPAHAADIPPAAIPVLWGYDAGHPFDTQCAALTQASAVLPVHGEAPLPIASAVLPIYGEVPLPIASAVLPIYGKGTLPIASAVLPVYGEGMPHATASSVPPPLAARQKPPTTTPTTPTAAAPATRPYLIAPGTSAWQTFHGRLDNALANIREATAAALHHHAAGILLTSWGDNGNHQPWFTMSPPLTAAAALAWNPTAHADIPHPDSPALAHAIASIFLTENTPTKESATTPIPIPSIPTPAALTAARAILSLGQTDRFFRKQIRNKSILWELLFAPSDALPALLQDISDTEITAALAAADAATTALANFPPLALEAAAASALIHLAANRARLARAHPDITPAALQRAAHAAISLYETAWLSRAREGGLAESTTRILEHLLPTPTPPTPPPIAMPFAVRVCP